MEPFPDPIRRFMAAVGPEPTSIQREMERHAREEGFPIIGPSVGGVVTVLARMVGARRVFEMGSGFGYSATWFLRGLAEDGEVVLTEVDADEAELGESFLERAGEAGRTTVEVGDAHEIFASYDGPFDAVLLDHRKRDYVEAFEAAREKLSPGGVVIADNTMVGPHDFESVLEGLEGAADPPEIVDYLRHVRAAEGFETVVLPVGSGVAVSHRDR